MQTICIAALLLLFVVATVRLIFSLLKEASHFTQFRSFFQRPQWRRQQRTSRSRVSAFTLSFFFCILLKPNSCADLVSRRCNCLRNASVSAINVHERRGNRWCLVSPIFFFFFFFRHSFFLTTDANSTANFWSSASQWSTGFVPNNETDVIIDLSSGDCKLNPVLVIDVAASVKSLKINSMNSQLNIGCVTVVQVQMSFTANSVVITENAWLHFETNSSSVSCAFFSSTGAIITGFGTVTASSNMSLVSSEIQPGQNGGTFIDLLQQTVPSNNKRERNFPSDQERVGRQTGVVRANFTLCQRCYSPVRSRFGVLLGDLMFLSPSTLLDSCTIRVRFLSSRSSPTFLPSWKTTPVDRVIFRSLTAVGVSDLFVYFNDPSEIVNSINIVSWKNSFNNNFNGTGSFNLTRVSSITPYPPHLSCSYRICGETCTSDCSGSESVPRDCLVKKSFTGIGVNGGGDCTGFPLPGSNSEVITGARTGGELCGGGGLSVLIGACDSGSSSSVQLITPGSTSTTTSSSAGNGNIDAGSSTSGATQSQSTTVLSTGAIVGIAVGGALVGAAAIVLIVVIARKAAESRLKSNFAKERAASAAELQYAYRNVAL